MSKMNRPEMDVVRFQESDVIVASSFILKGMGNGKEDGVFIFGGKDYSVANTGTRNPFYADFKEQTGTSIGDMSVIYFGGVVRGTLSSVVGYDTVSDPAYDGTYYWDKASNSFKFRQ